MKLRARYIILPVFILAVLVIFLFGSRQKNSLSGNTAINENIIQTKGFSVTSESTELNTSAYGTVFIKGSDGTPDHVQIVAHIEIDPDDWGGVTFYITDWHISSIISSYPENKAQSLPAKNYVSAWTTKDPMYELNTMIEIGYDHSGKPTGGGTGSVVIDLYTDKKAIQQAETFKIMIAIGSDEKDGIKISQPDFITLEIPMLTGITTTPKVQIDISNATLNTALAEAEKVGGISGIAIKELLSKDTAYLSQTNDLNVCEVVFPVSGYDFYIGVSFTRKDENSEWTLLPVNAVTVYDPGRWTETKEYLKTDHTKAEAYNDAIKAYNEFLSDKTDAIDKITNRTFNIKEMSAFNKPGINSFALFDVNVDGIPELHTRSDFYDIFTYQDGQLVRWYTPGMNLMDGSVIALDNGAIFSKLESTGTDYQYITFGLDGKATTITFAAPNNSSRESPYYFNNKEVSKDDYDNLTNEYFASSKKPASIQWQNYE